MIEWFLPPGPLTSPFFPNFYSPRLQLFQVPIRLFDFFLAAERMCELEVEFPSPLVPATPVNFFALCAFAGTPPKRCLRATFTIKLPKYDPTPGFFGMSFPFFVSRPPRHPPAVFALSLFPFLPSTPCVASFCSAPQMLFTAPTSHNRASPFLLPFYPFYLSFRCVGVPPHVQLFSCRSRKTEGNFGPQFLAPISSLFANISSFFSLFCFSCYFGDPWAAQISASVC